MVEESYPENIKKGEKTDQVAVNGVNSNDSLLLCSG